MFNSIFGTGHPEGNGIYNITYTVIDSVFTDRFNIKENDAHTNIKSIDERFYEFLELFYDVYFKRDKNVAAINILLCYKNHPDNRVYYFLENKGFSKEKIEKLMVLL